MELSDNVLVVDDDPGTLTLLSDTLEGAGYRVTTASDAWQEVVQVQGMKIGLVISDIQMPGAGTGVDAVKRLRSLPTVSPRLPVIFITGMKLDEARRLIPQDPLVRLLAKPVDFAQMRAVIKELTGIDRPI